MAILDIFKKSAKGGKKTGEMKEKKPMKKKESIEVVEKEEKKEEVAEEKKTEKQELGESNIAYRILKSPQVTEKAINLSAENKYVFRINKFANKAEAKKAIQDLYNVRVISVNIINIPRKKRRLGRSEGFKPGYKKAIVTLRKGDKIETGI